MKVVDFELKPERLEIKAGGRIDFRWSAKNSNPHQIVLRKAPKGVDKSEFVSPRGERNVEFEPQLTRPGDYRFFCNIHPISMSLDVAVKGSK